MADATNNRGNAIFSGPDGVALFHRYIVRDASHVGSSSFSPERTSDVTHIWRASPRTPHPSAKRDWVGAIGWNAWSYNDWRLLKSNQQIKRGPFRAATETRILNDGVFWANHHKVNQYSTRKFRWKILVQKLNLIGVAITQFNTVITVSVPISFFLKVYL